MGVGSIKNIFRLRPCLPARSGKLALLVVLVLAASALAPRPARACYTICEIEFNIIQEQILNAYIQAMHTKTQQTVNQHTDAEFRRHHRWMEGDDFFSQSLGSAIFKMAEQFSAIALQQMQIVGSFLDAKHQMETNRLFQQLAAQAHKDYHPSEGLCTIGTAARNLPGSERDGEMAALVLARRSQDRQLMNANSSGAEGAWPEAEG